MQYNRSIDKYSRKPEEVILKRCLYVNPLWLLKIEVLGMKITLILLIDKSPCQLCSDLSMSYHGIYILHHGIEFKNSFNSKCKNLWLNEVKQIALQSL